MHGLHKSPSEAALWEGKKEKQQLAANRLNRRRSSFSSRQLDEIITQSHEAAGGGSLRSRRSYAETFDSIQHSKILSLPDVMGKLISIEDAKAFDSTEFNTARLSVQRL